MKRLGKWLGFAITLLMIGTCLQSALASGLTPTGFYYPVDSPVNKSSTGFFLSTPCTGYWTGQVHLGWDLGAAVRAPVYAVAAGTVLHISRDTTPETKSNTAGWNCSWDPDGNVAIAILHHAKSGPFVAIYGHIRLADPTKRSYGAGEIIGTVGPYPCGGSHLHFGVYPGSSLPSKWGRYEVRDCPPPDPHGFTEPIGYIEHETPLAPPVVPIIRVSSPANRQNYVMNGTLCIPCNVLPITWQVSNADSSQLKYTVVIDGVQPAGYQASNATTYKWNPTSDGYHTCRVLASDGYTEYSSDNIVFSISGTFIPGLPGTSINPPSDSRGGGDGPDLSSDNSAYVSDVTIPDGMVFSLRQAFTKIWRIKNTGTTTWGSGYKWTFDGGDQMGGASIDVPSIAPGATWDPSVNLVAPAATGAYKGYWRLQAPSRLKFGTQVWVKIGVNGTDASAYVADITIPDGTVFSPGQSFTKTWRIKNTGTTTWGSGYKWTFDGGDQMGGASIDVPSIAPGATWDPSVNLVAPAATGAYKGYWRLQAPSGTKFGTQDWVQIGVNGTDASAYVADITIPDGTVFSPGQSFTKTWRIKNTGTTTWGRGYKWTFDGGDQMGGASIDVPSIAPGATWDPSVNLVAPSSPGTYKGYWRLQSTSRSKFGTQVWVKIGVNGTDASAYVADITIPDGTVFSPGQGFTKTWRIKNTGTTTWGSGYKWTFDGGDQMGGASIDVPSIAPGETWDPSVNLVAPTSPGTYKGYWRLQAPSGTKFGTQDWVQIGVNGTDASAYVADITIPDGTVFSPGQSFTKTWRIKNTGTTTWGSGYKWTFDGGDQMGGASIDVPSIAPGETWDPSVNLVAPAATGTYKGYWRLQAPSGTKFGTQDWVQIGVNGTDASAYVADITIPDGTVFSPGQSFTKTWRIKNTGTTTWGSGYKWTFDGGDQMGGPASIDVPSIAPGGTWDPSVNLIAPASKGNHKGYWRLRAPSGTKFGTQVWVLISG